MIIVLKLIVIIALVMLIAFLLNKHEKEKVNVMSFREALELTELPIVAFKINGKNLHFLLDTGSNRSIINKKIAEKLEAVKQDGVKAYGLEGKVVEGYNTILRFNYRDKYFEEGFQVLDMTEPFRNVKHDTGVTLHGILGNSFLEKYKYVLDFNKMIAYPKS